MNPKTPPGVSKNLPVVAENSTRDYHFSLKLAVYTEYLGFLAKMYLYLGFGIRASK